jgi:hypothetical protein
MIGDQPFNQIFTEVLLFNLFDIGRGLLGLAGNKSPSVSGNICRSAHV